MQIGCIHLLIIFEFYYHFIIFTLKIQQTICHNAKNKLKKKS